MPKETKTNAMRILEKLKLPYTVNLYECEEFIDGVHVADALGQPYDRSFKTLIYQGKSGAYYVFVLPIAETLDLKKAARAVGEKSVSHVAVKEIQTVTGYIRGGCTPIGMKKPYRTVLHESAAEFSEIIISGGRIGTQLLLAPGDLCRATGASYADILLDGTGEAVKDT